VKVRFIAAPWAAMLGSGAWLRNARHANEMAKRLERELGNLAGVRVLHPVEANAVFVQLPPGWSEALHQRGWHYYSIADGDRLMCAWDTTEEDIEAYVADVRGIAAFQK